MHKEVYKTASKKRNYEITSEVRPDKQVVRN